VNGCRLNGIARGFPCLRKQAAAHRPVALGRCELRHNTYRVESLWVGEEQRDVPGKSVCSH